MPNIFKLLRRASPKPAETPEASARLAGESRQAAENETRRLASDSEAHRQAVLNETRRQESDSRARRQATENEARHQAQDGRSLE